MLHLKYHMSLSHKSLCFMAQIQNSSTKDSLVTEISAQAYSCMKLKKNLATKARATLGMENTELNCMNFVLPNSF